MFEKRGVGGGPEVFHPDEVIALVAEDSFDFGFLASKAVDQWGDTAEGAVQVTDDPWEGGLGVLRELKRVTGTEEIWRVEGGGVWVTSKVEVDGAELKLGGEAFDHAGRAERASADDWVGGFGEEDEGASHQRVTGSCCGWGAGREASFST